MVDDGIAVIRELVEGQRAADHPKVRHQPANHRLEEQFVRNQRGLEERDDVGLAGQPHDFLQTRPGENPPLRAEERRHVAHEAAPEPQATLQREGVLGQIRPVAPVEVPAILVTLPLRAAFDPFDRIGRHALDELVAFVALEELFEFFRSPDRVIHAAHEIDVIGLPTCGFDGLETVQSRLHDRPFTPTDPHPPCKADPIGSVSECRSKRVESAICRFCVVMDDDPVSGLRHCPR